MKSSLLLLLLCCTSLCALYAQPSTNDSFKKVKQPIQRFYVGNGMDAAIFSSATIQHTVNGTTTNNMAPLRFSGFLNLGFTFNLNLNRHLGLYTGIDIKNIGFIEHTGGFVTKRRTYNLGAPLGIKIGNMERHGGYLFLGGGADVPINYKEKTFQIRDQKTKLTEWFSGRTPALMPYLFAGVTLNPGITVKAQYYPGNFLNPNYTKNGVQPYQGYDVHLMMLSLGFRINYSKRTDIVKKSVEETKVM